MADDTTNEANNLMLTDEALEMVSGGAGWGVANTPGGPKEMWNLRPGESIQYRPERRGNEILMFDRNDKQVGKAMPYTAERGKFLGV